MTDTLRDEVEREMRAETNAFGGVDVEDAVSVAVRLIERERESKITAAIDKAWEAQGRAEAAEFALKEMIERSHDCLAAERECDEARRALAERGHVANCYCHESPCDGMFCGLAVCYVEVHGSQFHDPRCAPPQEPK